jgi:hypothetical protein
MSSEQNVMSFGKMFSELISFGQMYLRLNIFRSNLIRAKGSPGKCHLGKCLPNSILEMMKLKLISRVLEKYKVGTWKTTRWQAKIQLQLSCWKAVDPRRINDKNRRRGQGYKNLTTFQLFEPTFLSSSDKIHKIR